MKLSCYENYRNYITIKTYVSIFYVLIKVFIFKQVGLDGVEHLTYFLNCVKYPNLTQDQ